MAALQSLGQHPVHVPRDHYSNESDFRTSIDELTDHRIPVIAGPLDLALSLTGTVERLVLLSWGFDLQEAPPDLNLETFHAVIVDSSANEGIARVAGARRIIKLPWGVDLRAIDSSTPIADLSDYGLDPNERVVISLRAHEPRYRVADIIEAFARRPRAARLVIGNSGSITPELRQLAQELNTDAVFLPAVSEEQVPSLLRRADCYVTASEVDGTSVTLLQAMACKVPVVASANAGNVDWVDDGLTGFMFPIADIDALDDAIKRALDPHHEVTGAARRRVEESADWQRNIHALQPIL